jgi:hypothetical protein
MGGVLIGRGLPRSPLTQVSAVHIQAQVEPAQRLVVETWLRRNGVITITQDKKVLPIFLAESAQNWLASPGIGKYWPTRQDLCRNAVWDAGRIGGDKGISRQISLTALSVANFRVADHLDTVARGGGWSVLFREIAPHDSALICRPLPWSSQNPRNVGTVR